MKSCCKEKSNCFKYHDGVDKRRPVFSYTGALNYKPILCPNISLYSNINTPLLEKEHSLKHRYSKNNVSLIYNLMNIFITSYKGFALFWMIVTILITTMK
jgi:hypothetical protein